MEPPEKSDLDSSSFCSRCSKIDFDYVAKRSRSTDDRRYRDEILRINGTIDDSWASPSCSMCQLLKAVAPPSSYTGLKQSIAWWNDLSLLLLRPYEPERILGKNAKSTVLIVKDKQSAQSGPDPDRSLCLQSDSAPSIKVLDPQHIDFSTLHHWFSTCLESHDEFCGLEEAIVLQGLQVINIHTRRLELAAKGTRYVALSYIWGSGSVDTGLHDFPPTIQDAMTVTEKMGFAYLWVDRYCIPQGESKSKEKHNQIKQMDRIYRQAELTIIAAAGQSPDHGLPGVGSTSRVPQPSVRVGKHTLISTLTSPRALIHGSLWYSRAWTYQEGICSRRRLLFTDEQVFFECQQMSCRETVDYMWATSNHQDLSMQCQIFTEVYTPQGGLDSALQHITNYSKRQLTYDSDALNAILGVLRLYSSKEVPVFHFWGVLIAPRCDINAEASWESALETFCQAFLHRSCDFLNSDSLRRGLQNVLWKLERTFSSREDFQMEVREAFLGMRKVVHSPPNPLNIMYKTILKTKRVFSSHDSMEKAFIKSLCWIPETAGRRRPDFPSWSWAGWTCPIRCSRVAYEPRRYAVKVSIGFKSGRFKSLEYVFHHHIKSDDLKNTVGILRLRARVVKLKTKVFCTDPQDGNDNGKPVLFAWPMEQDKEFKEVQLVAPIKLLEPMDKGKIARWQKEPPHLLGILMEYGEDEHLPKQVLALVVSAVDGRKYQRVGHLILDDGVGDGGAMPSKNVVTGDYVKIDVDERISRRRRWETNRVRSIDLV